MIIVLNLFDLVRGKEAEYSRYLERVQPILDRYQAEVLFYGRARAVFRGTCSQDYCGVISYRDIDSLHAFSHDPEFIAIRSLRDGSTTNYVLSVFEETGEDGELTIGQWDQDPQPRKIS